MLYALLPWNYKDTSSQPYIFLQHIGPINVYGVPIGLDTNIRPWEIAHRCNINCNTSLWEGGGGIRIRVRGEQGLYAFVLRNIKFSTINYVGWDRLFLIQ